MAVQTSFVIFQTHIRETSFDDISKGKFSRSYESTNMLSLAKEKRIRKLVMQLENMKLSFASLTESPKREFQFHRN